MSDDPNAAPEAADAAAAPAAPEAKPDAVIETPATPAADPAKTEDATAAVEDFKLTAPEGAEAFQGDFDAFAGAMDGWLKANPNATAREALAEAANRQAAKAHESAQHMTQQMADWTQELRDDKEFGGERFDQSVATAVKGIEAVGSPELRSLLDTTGMGNHPSIVRAFQKVGQLVADAPFATGTVPASAPKGMGARMYPNMKQ
ncbi:hypothetical protein [Paracoccus shanxieyensis]|uniref:Peptidase n=1 Tax=Paracoccus shanxieyensis TaxID=2675752 RepID=A0A6L6IYT2_9RHOB|nr:hypothetical protein [Paracoccus shanxieyensis]MTH65069.1 hypothetical protein [Paracoccus shanxieyensis]MTH88213.1 hypothetical protein [Paracoccus shanxieyensis]